MVMLNASSIHPIILDFMKGQAEFIDNSGTLNESIYFASFFTDFKEVFIPMWESVEHQYRNACNKANNSYSDLDVIEYSHWLFEWCEYNKYKKVIGGIKPYGSGTSISDEDMFNKFLEHKNSVKANEISDAIDQWHELEVICKNYFYCILTGH
jgi:hypothetical protein